MESELVQEIHNIANSIDALAQPRFIDWLAVVFSFVSIAISGVAIWFAVQVPKKIANKQNKIALFEKRYECFVVFTECYRVYARIKDKCCTIEELRDSSKYIFGKLNWEDITRETTIYKIEQYEYILHQMKFLFPGISEYDTYLLSMGLKSFLVSVIENNNVTESTINYINSMRYFCKKYSKTIFDSLKI